MFRACRVASSAHKKSMKISVEDSDCRDRLAAHLARVNAAHRRDELAQKIREDLRGLLIEATPAVAVLVALLVWGAQ